MADTDLKEQSRVSRWMTLLSSLGQAKTGYMLIFGFSSGLPYALVLGTLYAWLSEVEVDLETMGVFSLIGLAYAFQFLWSPLIDKLDIPLFSRLGKRKQWILPAQLLIGAALVIMSMLDPKSQLGWFSLLAGTIAIASATQDIAINAWRIELADEKATLDTLSAVYQMGYRLAALVGGAFGLIIAAAIGWPQTYLLMGAILLVIGAIGLFAPDAPVDTAKTSGEPDPQLLELRQAGELTPEIRAKALIAVGALWAAAIGVVLTFMVMSLRNAPEDRPDPTLFTLTWGPLIIIATVIVPAGIAGWLSAQKRKGTNLLPEAADAGRAGGFAMDHLYRALVLPLVEFVSRMGWALVLILALVLTYRITDSIWGTFAYPFYLGELKFTKEDVAFASKIFGVFAIIAGLGIGATMLNVLGRMMTLTIGALLAALTNLLYAELAVGGSMMQSASDAIGFTYFIDWLTWVFSFLFVTAPPSEGIAKLAFVIMFENIAVGIAGAAFVAYLSSIVNKKFSAVQYALLSSLTMLMGTLGRGALGEMIEEQGYYDVFLLTTFIGFVAVALCIAEWLRQTRLGEEAAGVVTRDRAPEPKE
jgi:PAT family beta-lactamase induction signal transducer AmpG